MIRVFTINGAYEPKLVEWQETPMLHEEWTDASDYVFAQIQKWCDTDMAVPIHRIQSDPRCNIVFYGDEDARLKKHFTTMRWYSDLGTAYFYNKIVAICEDNHGNFIEFNDTAERLLDEMIGMRILQFPIFPLRVPSNG